MNQLVNKLSKYEKILFFLVILLNLIPVLNHRFFPTLDGPAHLYNATLINHMLFNSDFDAFLQFNPEAVPNWTGHLLLCFFKGFLPGYLAEKFLFIAYFVGLAYAFRNLIKSFNPGYMGLSYLIFPLTYNFLFSLGFYNFSLGLIGLLLILAFWVKNQEIIARSPKKMILFGILLLLTYFSHILMFSAALLAVSCYTFCTFLKQYIQTRKFKETFLSHLKKTLILVTCSLVPLILMMVYFVNRAGADNQSFIPGKELLKMLVYIKPIICYQEEIEKEFTRKLAYILFALIIAGIYYRIKNRKTADVISGERGLLRLTDSWLLITGIMILLLFKIADASGMVSIISIRFALLAFLFLLIWIASLKPAKWFIFVCSVLLLVVQFKRVRYFDEMTEIHSQIAVKCKQAEKFIEPGSVVGTVNLTNNWLLNHFSNYLGIDKPMIILENYEANMDYFPLKWNIEKVPNMQIAGQSVLKNPLFSSYKTNLANEKRAIDYIFVLGHWDTTNPVHVQDRQLIPEQFQEVFRNNQCILYRYKKAAEPDL
ncbi:hypothetical protein D3C87_63730 [compost metagenome]